MMMSDEEECGDTYIRHRPSHRSKLLNEFISKLESRCETTQNIQPRKKRTIGYPVSKTVPLNAKNWVLKPEFRSGAHPNLNSDPRDEPDSDDSAELL